MRQQLHIHYGSDVYPHRKAVVFLNKEKDCFEVEFWNKKQLQETREMITDGVAHSERYAEDAAENWCLGYMP